MIVAAIAALSAPVDAQDVPQVSEAPAEGSRPAPTTNPGTWVTTEDYPKWAVVYEVDGRVRFSVGVDTNGRVSTCEIVESSGIADLDQVTCEKITERARFRPARDAQGNPVAGEWTSVVRWQLPEDEPNEFPPPGALAVSMVIETDGSVSECEVELAEGFMEKARSEACVGERHLAPVRGEDGQPRRTRIRTVMRVEHEALGDK